MVAYLISDITVRDGTVFEVYRTRAADAIHTLTAGAILHAWEKCRYWKGIVESQHVFVEFPSLEQARAVWLARVRIRARDARQMG